MNTPRNLSFVIIFCLTFGSAALRSQSIWTLGPMLHINIGGEKPRASFALELAYWNTSHFPYSFDFAVEFEKKRIRLYSEAQTGIGVAGISAGPVLEFQTDKSATRLGFQTSVWGNYFLGFDARVRFIDKHVLFCPGTYVKLGFAGRDKNGNSTSGSSSGSFDDFD